MTASESDMELNTQPVRIIEGGQIDGEPIFCDATRIPLPERTHAQELLDLPILLENRIAHLIPYVEPTARVHTVHTIATTLGVNNHWIKKTSEQIGIATIKDVGFDGATREVYPILTLELLEEELAWVRAYQELEPLVSSYTIGQFLARHPDWVEYMAAELEVYHTQKTKLGFGIEGYGYPKELALMLRHIMLLTPPAEDRLTLDALSEITGRKKDWIKRRLDERTIESDQRRSLATGAIAAHYPWDSLRIINEIIENEPIAAGDWLTIGTMARLLGKDYEWVSARVKDRYEDLAQLRLDDDHKVKYHYPPEVFEALKTEANEIKTFEIAGEDDFALYALAKAVGHEQKWVVARLPYTNIVPTTKLNPVNNRLLTYYKKSDAELLKLLPLDIIRQPHPNDLKHPDV